jgi:phosphoribosylformylglycinamidine synthase II
MIQVVRVSSINEKDDLKALSILGELKNSLITKVRTNRLYRLEGITKVQAKILAEKLFSEEINQNYSLDKPLINGKSQKIEIAYKPGVMNPEVTSIVKAAKDLGIKLVAADSSMEYHFFGKVPKDIIDGIVRKLSLLNNTVEYIVTKEPKTLLIAGKVGPTNVVLLRKMGDEELLSLSKDKLFLNLEEMKIIQSYFQKIKRDPTDCELETLAQTWSEHCAHKTFKAKLIVDGKNKEPLMSRLKKEALKHDRNIVSAFVDNSGVMEFYDGMSICGKVETHNSPCAIEPYGGAMTGSGGVFRDVLGTGQGAKTIASTDIFCFANPNLSDKQLPVGCLRPDYLLKRVVTGVRDYGNRMGIPTNNGSVHFHNDFRAKPTIIVGAYGIIPTKQAQKGQAKTGDVCVAMGGRTGRDGIHGATFSSAEMTDRTINVNSSAVQIGNAIEEKRMFDAIIEARDAGLIRAIQDCGAGGFSSAIGEMGEETGVKVDLASAPLKYQGLSPWEIWISEAQERMVVATAPKNLKKLLAIFKKYNVETSILGKFDKSKKLRVYYGKKLVCDLEMEFLHHGLPQRTMKATKPTVKSQKEIAPKAPKTQNDWIKVLGKVLSHGNICSKEPIIRMYDHSVQGTNDMQSYSGELLDGPNDAVVLRPFLNKKYGMLISHGLNPVLNRVDPYYGSLWAIAEAVSNYVASGGDFRQASLINNYIWPFPDEESLWTLERSVNAVVDAMKILKIPVISGKDSLSSTYRSKDGKVIKIPEVLCMSVFGKIPDTTKTMTADFKKENSVICLVGKPDYAGMAGSVYYDTQKLLGLNLPKVDLRLLAKIAIIIYRNLQTNKILSIHDISEGGLITAIFEMCVGGNMGVGLNLSKIKNDRIDYVLFNETAGSFVVEVENEKVARQVFKNIPFAIIGKTRTEQIITVQNNKQTLFSANLEALKKSWQKPMRNMFP